MFNEDKFTSSDALAENQQSDAAAAPKLAYATPRLTMVGQLERITLQDTGGIIDDGEIT